MKAQEVVEFFEKTGLKMQEIDGCEMARGVNFCYWWCRYKEEVYYVNFVTANPLNGIKPCTLKEHNFKSLQEVEKHLADHNLLSYENSIACYKEQQQQQHERLRLSGNPFYQS